jgi:hypothetical protein
MATVLPVAAGDHDGVTHFQPGLNSYITPEGSEQVSVTRIDSLGVAKVDFIKIDVEGYEGAVLDGARETIEKTRPVLFLELHPNLLTQHTHREAIDFLRQYYSRIAGYKIERVNLWGRVLQAYGLVEPFTKADDLDELLEAYENKQTFEPCWLLAQP